METITSILNGSDMKAKKALFLFDKKNTNAEVLFKFNLWGRYFFPKYYKSKDAPFHKDLDMGNIEAYRGDIEQFVNVAFRGAAKTARTKLFLAFVITNDIDHHRRYIRCLSAEVDNAKQSVTDIYNMLISPRVNELYSEVFQATTSKREETMGSFTTATGVKMLAKQVGVDQRGNIMEDAKADFDWYDDFETKTTLYSARKGKKIWDNMEEARTGLAQGGASIYTCNYISERGNVHTLVTKKGTSKKVMNIPIMDSNGNPTWERYTKEEIERMKIDDDDFWGERMGKPSASKDAYFDRETLDKQVTMNPIKELAGFKIYREYNPSHRIAGGADIAGGLGLDSSTSVFIDFDTIPAQVVGTFVNNEISPEVFGDELARQGNIFGTCLLAPENNKYDSCIGRLKQVYPTDKIHKTQKSENQIAFSAQTTFGWNTNQSSKPKMLSMLRDAIEDGLLQINDEDILNELKSYTRNDLLDRTEDVRLVTRHWDLIIALAIAWQMKDHARAQKKLKEFDPWARFEDNKPKVLRGR